jgi:hypothetical protein
MFEDDDPVLIRVRRLALDLPGAAEKVSHGRPTFYTVKVFAYYGGSVKIDGVYEQHHESILVLPDPDERLALVEDPRCYVPAYLGAYGWVGFDIAEGVDGGDGGDWAEVAELLDASYRYTAPAKRVAELGARTG